MRVRGVSLWFVEACECVGAVVEREEEERVDER